MTSTIEQATSLRRPVSTFPLFHFFPPYAVKSCMAIVVHETSHSLGPEDSALAFLGALIGTHSAYARAGLSFFGPLPG